MEAKVKNNALYGWRSICAARPVIARSSRWRVGTGNEIKIWEDPWIPIPSRFRIFSTKLMGCNITLVNQLVCQQSHTWNFPILKSIFSEWEVDVIVSSLSIRKPEDKLIWHFDKKGKFSVKSAYQIAWRWQSGEVAASWISGRKYGQRGSLPK